MVKTIKALEKERDNLSKKVKTNVSQTIKCLEDTREMYEKIISILNKEISKRKKLVYNSEWGSSHKDYRKDYMRNYRRKDKSSSKHRKVKNG